jgi:(E)-4-hydroxy-3-methylbut-2-enyl-diphosphate synthase
MVGSVSVLRQAFRPQPRRRRDGRGARGPADLQSLEIRSFTPQVTNCPGCGRTTSTYCQKLAEEIQGYLRQREAVVAGV